MNTKRLFQSAVLALAFAASQPATALTMDQFSAICNSGNGSCSENPALQAYVGGALDLLAALDEETDYLGTIYCKDPRELFDVAKIIDFMVRHRAAYAKNNAMLLLIRYFEEEGGCPQRE